MQKVVVVVLSVICIALCQTRPKFPEVFEGRGSVEIKIHNGSTVVGEAFVAANQPDGMFVEDYRIKGLPQLDMMYLSRYDMNTTFFVSGEKKNCDKNSVDGKMPKVWAWVEHATYKGKVTIHGRSLNLWEAALGHAINQVGVTDADPNVPVFTTRKSNARDFTVHYEKFSTHTPNKDIFKVPSECGTHLRKAYAKVHSELGCVSRSKMIADAQVWVANHVPYNQGGHYNGYREDCSGYVSMAWELAKPGFTTETLGRVSHRISKGELQPGDVLLDASEHVVLFAGWADSSQTHYHSMEETRPGEGTVARVTPYPYWYNVNAFLPFRYNSVC